MTQNKRGQESGTLQNILLALLLSTTVAYFLVGYLNGVSENYDVNINESQYTVFQKFGEVNQTISELTGQFISDDGEQIEDTDVISAMITSAYGLIKLVFNIPDLFFSLVTSAIASLGIAPEQASTLTGLAVGVIVIMILFAAVALVMKVRA